MGKQERNIFITILGIMLTCSILLNYYQARQADMLIDEISGMKVHIEQLENEIDTRFE